MRSFKILKKFKFVSFVKGTLFIKDYGVNGVVKKIKSRKEYKKYSNVTNNFKNIDFRIGTIDIVVDSNYDIKFVEKLLEKSKFKYNLFYITDNPENNSNKTNYKEINRLFLKQYFLYRSFVYLTNNVKIKEEFYNCIILEKTDDFVKKINDMLQNIDTLKLIANYNNKNNITVKAATFFNYDGTNYYSGGAERYLVDLYEVCKKMGYNLDIYQNANVPYMRKFRDINVIGLSTKKYPLNYSIGYIKEQSKNYDCATRFSSQLHIYSAFYECYPYCSSPSIGISHGIAWDNRLCKKTNGYDFWLRNERFIESAYMCDKMVSVDTNTANWFQTIDYEVGNQKIKVIPNYVDTKEFKQGKKRDKDDDKIVITYPRRLYEPRGMYLLLDIIDRLFNKYDNLEIHFVGKGFDEDLKNIKKMMDKYPNKVFCYSQDPSKMHEVYKKTDISLIPTLYSEGTSLSCLEAMATGNIVVATRIGGLTDLIINGYNGYLIEPTKEDLFNTLDNILKNYDIQKDIRVRARETAEVFNKERWNKSWERVIEDFKLKNYSDNIELVEFYVEDVMKISKKNFQLIKEELLNNNLVYIRSKKQPDKDLISCGLLQLVPWDDEIVSEASSVYVELKYKDEVRRKENIIFI